MEEETEEEGRPKLSQILIRLCRWLPQREPA